MTTIKPLSSDEILQETETYQYYCKVTFGDTWTPRDNDGSWCKDAKEQIKRHVDGVKGVEILEEKMVEDSEKLETLIYRLKELFAELRTTCKLDDYSNDVVEWEDIEELFAPLVKSNEQRELKEEKK